MANDQIRKQYIDAATQVLEQEGLEAITARRISAMVGMNPANIYRHFSDLNELSMYASVSILKSYILDVRANFDTTQGIYQNFIHMWELFCQHVFQNVLVFDQLFFGVNRDRLPDIVRQYYSLYPEQLEGFEGGWKEMLSSGSFDERCRISVQLCCEAGIFRREDMEMLLAVPRYVFMGCLHEAINSPNEPERLMQLSRQCMRYLNGFFELYRQSEEETCL